MITIVKDNDRKVVSKGAYENLYKSLGYNIIGKVQPIVNNKSDIVENKKTNEIVEDDSTDKTDKNTRRK